MALSIPKTDPSPKDHPHQNLPSAPSLQGQPPAYLTGTHLCRLPSHRLKEAANEYCTFRPLKTPIALRFSHCPLLARNAGYNPASFGTPLSMRWRSQRLPLPPCHG